MRSSVGCELRRRSEGVWVVLEQGRSRFLGTRSQLHEEFDAAEDCASLEDIFFLATQVGDVASGSGVPVAGN